MFDKKLTDSEIAKALEEWIKELKDDYKRLQLLDAPMDCLEESHADTVTKLSNALNLINRLQTEKEKLEKENDELKNGYFQRRYEEDEHLELMGLREAYEKKGKECDYFQLKSMNLEDDVKAAKTEIERLKLFEEKIAEYDLHIRVEDMLVCASSLGEWLEFCDNLKAEAYKEFTERFLEKAIATRNYCEMKSLVTTILYEMEKKNNASI